MNGSHKSMLVVNKLIIVTVNLSKSKQQNIDIKNKCYEYK